MKKLLKFAPLCALLLALVAFILILAGHGISYASKEAGVEITGWMSSGLVLFGKGQTSATAAGHTLTTDVEDYKGAWNAVLAFILVIVALVALLLSSLMVFVKVKALEKFSGLIALVAAGLLLVAGIFLFFTVPAFAAANDMKNTDGYAVGGAWVVAAILAILGGLVSAFPAVLALVEKK